MSTEQNQDLSPGTVIAYAGIKPAPWRNGGGVTRQIASGKLGVSGFPDSVSGDEWDWRLSIADVESEGPFSAFVGMTRILTVIEGEGLAITIDGAGQVLERYRPLRFDGGSATSATLPFGPIRDFNLMTRTGTVTGHVSIEELSPEHPLQLAGGRLGVLLQGQATVLAGGNQAQVLERYDTIMGGNESTPSISGRGFVAVVSLEPAEA
ncbi:HutD family protein [Paeniglutamicibacter sp. MACA_103]|uniref:HutD family protein n=1 Tax=Paeniglutamicibacter sp. MACA_103 TaxID=3377337 RepID=UPI0038942822